MPYPIEWGRTPFLILIAPSGELLTQADDPLRDWLRENISLSLTKLAIAGLDIAIYHGTPLLKDSGQNLTMLFAGRFFSTDHVGNDEQLLDLGLKLGKNLAPNLNGSFCLFSADKRSGTVSMATDRLNSCKVFYQKIKNNHLLCSSIWLMPKKQCELDQTELASFLANGSLLDNQTLIKGIKFLDRASIYNFEPQRLSHTKYWSFDLDQAYQNEAPKELKEELKRLLVHAVRRRLPQKGKLLLSLSGGYDATSILGILRYQLKFKDVECFSYGFPPHNSGCDERIAARLASRAGYKHSIIPSFDGDLAKVFEQSAYMGQSVARFCNEPAVFEQLNQEKFSQSASLMVGDECMGWNDGNLVNDQHVLWSLPICGLDTLSWMRDQMEPEIFDQLSGLLKDKRAQLIRKSSSKMMAHDRKDFLYLDQRLNNVILPWRHFHIEPYINTDQPLLDCEILEFVSHLPQEMRRGKELFKKTVKSLCPLLFLGSRALNGTTLNYWPSALRSDHGNQVITHLTQKTQGTLLDNFLPPDLPLELLAMELKNQAQQSPTLAKSLKKRLKKWDLKPIKQYRQKQKPTPRPVGPRVLLKRVLMLKLFLKRFEKNNIVY